MIFGAIRAGPVLMRPLESVFGGGMFRRFPQVGVKPCGDVLQDGVKTEAKLK